MDRETTEARFCAECHRCHSAEEGDLWAESSMLGLRITYFACMDGKVYDITGKRQIRSLCNMFIRADAHKQPCDSVQFNASEQFCVMPCLFATFQSGQVARELAFLPTRIVCRIISPLGQRTAAPPHDIGLPIT